MLQGRLVVLLLLLFLAGLSGCARRVWFTQPIREGFERGLGEAGDGGVAPGSTTGEKHSPSEFQYFVSERIVLEREVSSKSDALARGRIMVRRGRFVERVIVRRGTPGVAVGWGPDWVAVSFEKGTSLRFDLVSGESGAMPPSPGPAGGLFQEVLPSTYYQLHTSADETRGTVVKFDGKRYMPVGNTTLARLKIRRWARTKRRRSRHVMRGRRL